jgi:AbrB family looped-hinge helix DNA binding protein
MTIIETTKITSKGQVTIPNRVRKLLHLQEGSSVAFTVTKHGIVIVPCEVTARSPYSPKEWKKIEKLAAEEGKPFSSSEAAKKHLAGL